MKSKVVQPFEVLREWAGGIIIYPSTDHPLQMEKWEARELLRELEAVIKTWPKQ